jgi:hypothetical protein
MRTTTTSALSKRIEKAVATKKLSKNSLVYYWIQSILTGETTFRPVFSQGRTWKHSSLVDKQLELSIALRNLGLEYTVSNDAPRGGKTGVRIDLTTKVKNN